MRQGNAGADVEVVKEGVFQGNCHFVLAFDPVKFAGGKTFTQRMKVFCDGVGGTLPGQRASATAAHRAGGIPVAAAIAQELADLCAAKGIHVPFCAPAAST